MNKMNHIATTTYKVGFHDFMIDIVEDRSVPKYFESYIYKIGYDVKELMFGISKITHDEFLKIVEKNLVEYMHSYEEDNCD